MLDSLFVVLPFTGRLTTRFEARGIRTNLISSPTPLELNDCHRIWSIFCKYLLVIGAYLGWLCLADDKDLLKNPIYCQVQQILQSDLTLRDIRVEFRVRSTGLTPTTHLLVYGTDYR